ncbi:hypothetical protein L211DRAFT_890865 [Terfezia boudieri ATCC MYA-4762]|uniref:Uncharacterized protein n=1 Tax=Terfezia boudieri ATCC MYA-4762 TaxID=1051890 RepID=A0A3N4LYA1_9PEZI|nr:hypothetical protein L211DRAFT_890865 [Terfezia boudieri ATCC MYA-4762]
MLGAELPDMYYTRRLETPRLVPRPSNGVPLHVSILCGNTTGRAANKALIPITHLTCSTTTKRDPNEFPCGHNMSYARDSATGAQEVPPPTSTITGEHEAGSIFHYHNATEPSSTAVFQCFPPGRQVLTPRSRHRLISPMQVEQDQMVDRLADMGEENSKYATVTQDVQHTHIAVTQKNCIEVENRALEMMHHENKLPTTIFSPVGEPSAETVSLENPPFPSWSHAERNIWNIPHEKKITQEVRESYTLSMPPETTTSIETRIPIPLREIIRPSPGLNVSERPKHEAGCSRVSGLERAEALPIIPINLESITAVPSPITTGLTDPKESAWLKKFGFKNLGSASLNTARCESTITELKNPPASQAHTKAFEGKQTVIEALSGEEPAVESKNVMHGQHQRMQSMHGTSVISRVLPPATPFRQVSPNQKKDTRRDVINTDQSPGQLGKPDGLEDKNNTQHRDQNLKSETAQRNPMFAIASIAENAGSEFESGYSCHLKLVNDNNSEKKRGIIGTDYSERGIEGLNKITEGDPKGLSIAYEANVDLIVVIEKMSLGSAGAESTNTGKDGSQSRSIRRPVPQLAKPQIGITSSSILSTPSPEEQVPTRLPSHSIGQVNMPTTKGTGPAKHDKGTQAAPATNKLPSCFVKPKQRDTQTNATPRSSSTRGMTTLSGRSITQHSTLEGERRLRLLTSRGRTMQARIIGLGEYIDAERQGLQDCPANTTGIDGAGETFLVVNRRKVEEIRMRAELLGERGQINRVEEGVANTHSNRQSMRGGTTEVEKAVTLRKSESEEDDVREYTKESEDMEGCTGEDIAWDEGTWVPKYMASGGDNAEGSESSSEDG